MKMRVPPIRRIQFELHAERDEWGSLAGPIDQHPLQPSRLQRIWGTAHVYSDANASQIRAISEAVKKRCPVASMVIESALQTTGQAKPCRVVSKSFMERASSAKFADWLPVRGGDKAGALELDLYARRKVKEVEEASAKRWRPSLE
eukprot:g10898.t1